MTKYGYIYLTSGDDMTVQVRIKFTDNLIDQLSSSLDLGQYQWDSQNLVLEISGTTFSSIINQLDSSQILSVEVEDQTVIQPQDGDKSIVIVEGHD